MPAEASSDSAEEPPSSPSHPFQTAWPWILCIVGLDYMSTLGYVPSIAFDATGRLAPLVMAGVVLITILGALPIYCYLAGRSPHGKGALVLLEKLVPGWRGKFLVLILLGFAATDLIFTRTFSAADAAEHLIHGPHPEWQRTLDHWQQQWEANRHRAPSWVQKLTANWSNKQLIVTVFLLLVGVVVSIIFRRGFTRRFVQLAVLTVVLYMSLNAVILVGGLNYLTQHPELVDEWWQAVHTGNWDARAAHANGPVTTQLIAKTSLELFPKAALGLSGFEMAMLLMPMIRGRHDDNLEKPKGRIRNTRKMLIASAGLMSIFLIASSLVTTILIPPHAMRTDGQAANRAMAYLAHGGTLVSGAPGTILPFCGLEFGTLYDIVTVTILCLAGVSVALTLASFVPPYLHRLGMELDWVHKIGALIYFFAVLKLVVTILYRANVDEQRGAYTSSVLMIFAGGALTATIDVFHRRREKKRNLFLSVPILFAPITGIFLASAVVTMRNEPGGAVIAMWFILFIHFTSILTRMYRSTELRFKGFDFVDEQSRVDFEQLKTLNFPILVPHRPGEHSLPQKELEIRKSHRLPAEIPLVFVLVELGDPSDFYSTPRLGVGREEGRVVIRVTRCASVAHVIAAIAVEMSRVGVAPEIHFGWSDENPITANLHFVLFGHGNVPWMVYSILRKTDLPAGQQPRVVVG